MLQDLLPHYQLELDKLRRLGAELSEDYPSLAGRLAIGHGNSADPHVERLIESVAFLSAQIHKRMDDHYPDLTAALLGFLYPNLLSPIPSRLLVQGAFADKALPRAFPYRLQKGATIETHPISPPDGRPPVACAFQLARPLEIWPIEVAAAEMTASGNSLLRVAGDYGSHTLMLRLRCKAGLTFGDLGLDSLPIYIRGEPAVTSGLLELLHVRCAVAGVGEGEGGLLPGRLSIRAIGLEEDETLMPTKSDTFAGYAALQDYFSFPEGMQAFRLGNLGNLLPSDQTEADLFFVFFDLEEIPNASELIAMVRASVFQLNVAPAINIQRKKAEPIQLNHSATSYPVETDVRQPDAYEIISVDSVELIQRRAGGLQRRPLHRLFGDPLVNEAPRDIQWRMRWARAADGRHQPELVFVLPDADPLRSATDVAAVSVSCSNGDLPLRLTRGARAHDFPLSSGGPVPGLRALTAPRKPVRPPMGKSAEWAMVSHLVSNSLSLTEGGAHGLRGLLTLYAGGERQMEPQLSRDGRKQIEGVVAVTAEHVMRRFGRAGRTTYLQGLSITVTLDEAAFMGSGAFVFGLMLDRFFAVYASINSFTQLTLRSQTRAEPIHVFEPRVGSMEIV